MSISEADQDEMIEELVEFLVEKGADDFLDYVKEIGGKIRKVERLCGDEFSHQLYEVELRIGGGVYAELETAPQSPSDPPSGGDRFITIYHPVVDCGEFSRIVHSEELNEFLDQLHARISERYETEDDIFDALCIEDAVLRKGSRFVCTLLTKQGTAALGVWRLRVKNPSTEDGQFCTMCKISHLPGDHFVRQH